MSQLERRINKKLPWGTQAEMEELDLDLSEWGSCSRPVRDANVGCTFWKDCITRKTLGEVGRKNRGIRIYKGAQNEGVIVNSVVDCMALVKIKESVEAMEGAVDVIAEEGESITFTGTKRKVIKNADGTFTSLDEQTPGMERKVQPFPRPKDNPVLASVVAVKLAKLEHKERRAQEKFATRLGLDDSETKRSGTKKSG